MYGFKRYLSLATMTLLCVVIGGCDGEPDTTDELCTINPGLCDKYNTNDGQCRVHRTHTIWQDYETRKSNTDANKFKLLQHFIKYRHCLGLANQIELKKQKERAAKRSIAFTFSTARIKQLENELRDTDNPSALYYFWSQYGDRKAAKAFLELEGTPTLETPQLQFSLAGYYSTRDKDKAIEILVHALALYNDMSVVNHDIFKSLVSLSYQQGYYEYSYIWTIVSNNLEIIKSTDENLQRMFIFSETKRDELTDIADSVTGELRRGVFRSRNLPPPKRK